MKLFPVTLLPSVGVKHASGGMYHFGVGSLLVYVREKEASSTE